MAEEEEMVVVGVVVDVVVVVVLDVFGGFLVVSVFCCKSIVLDVKVMEELYFKNSKKIRRNNAN